MTEPILLSPNPPSQRPRKGSRLLGLILMLVLAVVLGVFRGLWQNPYGGRNAQVFSQIEYRRPDVEALAGQIDQLIASVPTQEDLGQVLSALRRIDTSYGDYLTQSTLCGLRYSIHTADPFYQAEQAFFDENNSFLRQKLDSLYYAIAGSPLEDPLEGTFFGEGFFDAYRGDTAFDQTVVSLMQEESRLVSEYALLMADPMISWQGQEQSYAALIADPTLSAPLRRQAAEIFYDTYNPRLGQLYVKLVGVRQQIAAHLGYDSYAQYRFETHKRSYTPQQADEYAALVRQELAPLYTQLEATGQWNQLYLLEEERLWELMGHSLQDMGGAVQEAYRFLKEYQLYDLAPNEDKQTGAYTTYLLAYDSPVIVASTTGTSQDLVTVSHEFGHFVDFYLNYGSVGGLDRAECLSQAMELLVFDRLEGAVEPEAGAYLLQSRLYSLLEAMVHQCSYHEFESRVYQLDLKELTVERLNALAAECFVQEEANALVADLLPYSWVNINHFFTSPFYTVSYSVTADVALQIYQLGDGALEAFLKLSRAPAGEELLTTLKSLALEDPLAQERVAALKKLYGELL